MAFKKPRKKALITPALLVIIGGGYYGINQALNAPSYGVQTNNGALVAKTEPIKQELPQSSAAENKYYSVSLPATFRAQNGGEMTPGALAQQRYIHAGAGGSQVVVITIVPVPSAGISSLSDYQLRTSGSRYARTVKPIAGSNVEIFKDTQSASAVAFWQRGGVIAEIGVNAGIADQTGDNNSAQFDAVEDILAVWEWR